MIEQEARQIDADTLKLIQRMANSLRKRRPQKTIKSREAARKGLTEEQQESLLNLIKPQSEKNPFSQEIQERNQLMVLLLYYLGLRAGELLALRVSDFDFQKNTVLVARRHDNLIKTGQLKVEPMNQWQIIFFRNILRVVIISFRQKVVSILYSVEIFSSETLGLAFFALKAL